MRDARATPATAEVLERIANEEVHHYEVLKGLKLWRRFFEMAGISLCVAVISFGVGLLMRKFVPVDI